MIESISKEPTYIETSGPFACLGAAMYLAIILYPDDIPKRNDFVNACRAWRIKRASRGQLKRRLVSNKAILEFAENRKIYAQFDKAEKILAKKRAPALEIFQFKLMSLGIPVYISKGEKFTINKWIEKRFPTPSSLDGLEYNKRNAYDRIWSPSKSIIHLVLGLVNSITDKQRPLSIENLILYPEWVAEAVKQSENIRNIILLTKAINIEPDQQKIVLAKEIS